MIEFIEPDRYDDFVCDLTEMHRLRYRVFNERLGWDLRSRGDVEIDEFDSCRPAYLLQKDETGRVRGCVRLLPTTGPTMLRDTFPELLDGRAPPASATIWESSRFATDLGDRPLRASGGIAIATFELFAALLEFGVSHHLSGLVTVTEARMERILCRARWPMIRLGQPRPIGRTIAIAGYLETSRERLQDVRIAGGLAGPVIKRKIGGPIERPAVTEERESVVA